MVVRASEGGGRARLRSLSFTHRRPLVSRPGGACRPLPCSWQAIPTLPMTSSNPQNPAKLNPNHGKEVLIKTFELATSKINADYMVQSVVRVLGPVHVPPPLPPINNAFDRCQGTIRAQKQAHGALQTVQSRMAAQKISCAKTGGAAKSRKKHPQN